MADATDVRRVTQLAGIVGLVVLAALCWAGLAGTQELPENILPTTFWVYVWVVVPLLCGLIGDFTSGSNPYGYLAQLGERAGADESTVAVAGSAGGRRSCCIAAGHARRTRVQPDDHAAAVHRLDAHRLRDYCVAMGAVFGASAFRQRGELFSALFGLWGRLGYFRFGAPGSRGFAGGLEAPFERSVSRTVFVLMLLVSISFDGILSTPQWGRFERNHVSFDDLHGQELLRSAAFLVLTLALYALFLAVLVRSRRGRRPPRSHRRSLSRLLPSLVPIAFGYLLAHYLQYVLVNGQLILPLLGAPGGAGTNLHLPYPFNDSYEVHTHFLPNSFYWYVDVVVIVVVHIVGRGASAPLPRPGRHYRARRSARRVPLDHRHGRLHQRCRSGCSPSPSPPVGPGPPELRGGRAVASEPQQEHQHGEREGEAEQAVAGDRLGFEHRFRRCAGTGDLLP